MTPRNGAGHPLMQRYQSRLRRREPACVEIEGSQALLEVDMNPLAIAGLACACDSGSDEASPDPFATSIRRDNRVDDERMNAAIPSHIDESNQSTLTPSAHPAEAVAMDLAMPVVFKQSMLERRRMESVHLGVSEAATPFIYDSHLTTLLRRADARAPMPSLTNSMTAFTGSCRG